MSEVASLADASLSYSGLSSWERDGRLDGFLGLARSVWRTRAYGDFWSHVLVAEGAVDISAEPEVKLWDLAALQVIVEEAGGTFTDLTGKPTPDGGSAVCTNGRLHSEVLDLLERADGGWRPPISPGGLTAPTGLAPGAEIADAGKAMSQSHKPEGERAMNVRDGMTDVVLTVGPAHTCARPPARCRRDASGQRS